MRSINRISLFVLFALQNVFGTGRPSLFAGRKTIRTVRAWWRHVKQGAAIRIEATRDWLADGLIRLADRLVPLPQAVPVLALETATPYGWGSVDLPEVERTPAPSFDPVPQALWDEVENAQDVQTVSVEEGLARMDAIMADVVTVEEYDRMVTEGKKKTRKARAAAHTSAPKAKARPSTKNDPIRNAKYEEVRFHMTCGDSQKTACKKVGVPESSYRSWTKKQSR
jgi:hypothetical protein